MSTEIDETVILRQKEEYREKIYNTNKEREHIDFDKFVDKAKQKTCKFQWIYIDTLLVSRDTHVAEAKANKKAQEAKKADFIVKAAADTKAKLAEETKTKIEVEAKIKVEAEMTVKAELEAKAKLVSKSK